MILMNLKLKNILAFSDFEINFSYPMKLRKSTIDNEFLSSITSFRYKKVNIFIGANATGKTSLMKCIWHCLIFLKNKERTLIDSISNKLFDDSYIELDLVEDTANQTPKLLRVKIKIDNKDKNILVAIGKIDLENGDSYESCAKDLDSQEYTFENYVDCLTKNSLNIGWYTALPATEEGFDIVRFCETRNNAEKQEYL